MKEFIPKWHKELEIFSRIKPLIILEGNVLDSYQYPEDGSEVAGSILPLTYYIHYFYKRKGYKNIVFYDSLRGFYNNCEKGYLQSFAKLTNTEVKDDVIDSKFKGNSSTAPGIVRHALTQTQEATVVIMNFASRYIVSPDNLQQNEVDSFTVLLQASLEAKDAQRKNGSERIKNILVLIVNKINDIPTWFYLQNPNVKSITLNYPAKEEREKLVKGKNFPLFFSAEIYKEDLIFYNDHPNELEKIQDRFIALTEGFSFTELNGLRRLCKNEKYHIHELCNVVDLYKYGIKENPWNKLNFEDIKNGETIFQRRVKGQDLAVSRTLDVIKRAITGLSGLQGSSQGRPKGVLFFAGPTGTGKTETAKTLAEMLFGDESACIRFDMSEYGQSHSDQKLLGAPPGYVGYEAGGQLTNAVKKNPFSILLFDEIEKAHPSILDKFLQILEDGRMTDGQGNTVYFSETIIIFTSNLGIYKRDQRGVREENVNQAMNYEEISFKVRQSIEDYFKLELGRPEILNRIGENIIVFDFIRPEIAKTILRAQIKKIVSNLESEKHITIEVSDAAYQILEEKALGNLSNGGRGIGNVVESLFINPLARYLFEHELFSEAKVRIENVHTDQMLPELDCSIKN